MKKMVVCFLLAGGLCLGALRGAHADSPSIGVNVQWPGSGGYPVVYPQPGYYPPATVSNGYSNDYRRDWRERQRREWRERQERERREWRERQERERREREWRARERREHERWHGHH
jgi:hypothetical protein